MAKVAANAIAFLVPWLVLTIATFAVIDVSAIPNGILPYWLAVLGYILFYYCALLAVGAGLRIPTGCARDGDHRRQRLGQLPHSIPAQAAFGSRACQGRYRRLDRRHRRHPCCTSSLRARLALGLAVYVRSRTGDFV